MRGTVRAATAVAAMTLGLLVMATGTAQAGAGAPGGDKASPQPALLDARAAAMAEGGAAVAEGVGINATWFTGTVPAGGSQGWVWNNASATLNYLVGFNPVGASTLNPCQFEVTSTRYVQQFGGEKEFQFTLRNISSIACGATVQLTWVSSWSIGSTGGLNPGQTQTWLWNNLPAGQIFLVGLTPSGSTSTAPCQIQVVRTWYTKQPGSDRELWFQLRNVGSIACQADVRLANPAGSFSFGAGSIGAGGSVTWTWNNANPVTSAYLLGMTPADASPNACSLEITRLFYRQVINSDGSSERELSITVRNIGSVTCSGTVNLTTIAA